MWNSLAIAVIGAVAAVSASFLTANATTNARANNIDTQVQVLKTTQSLQYAEVKDALADLKSGQQQTYEEVNQILKAIK